MVPFKKTKLPPGENDFLFLLVTVLIVLNVRSPLSERMSVSSAP
jgi:hypothetical protein